MKITRKQALIITAFILFIFLMLPVILYLGLDNGKTKNTRFTISGSAMSPNLCDKQMVFLEQLDQDKNENKGYERGDVIVYTNEEFNLIHRIIGLPGERVALENGSVLVNGEELEEDYLPSEVQGNTYHLNTTNLKVELENEEYFVLADNRLGSRKDSRDSEPVQKENILGKVTSVNFPSFFGTNRYDTGKLNSNSPCKDDYKTELSEELKFLIREKQKQISLDFADNVQKSEIGSNTELNTTPTIAKIENAPAGEIVIETLTYELNALDNIDYSVELINAEISSQTCEINFDTDEIPMNSALEFTSINGVQYSVADSGKNIVEVELEIYIPEDFQYPQYVLFANFLATPTPISPDDTEPDQNADNKENKEENEETEDTKQIGENTNEVETDRNSGVITATATPIFISEGSYQRPCEEYAGM